MKKNCLKSALIATLAASLSACVVAPPQPVGYRMTSSVLPTYVNGQYVGMQPSNYVPPAAQVAPAAPPAQAPQTATGPAPAPAAAATQQAPVYVQQTTPSVMYVQGPSTVYEPYYYGPGYYPYGAYPYYPPVYGYPWFGGIGLGFRIRVH